MFLFFVLAKAKDGYQDDSVWKPIRIKIDYDFLDGTKNDAQLCKTFGTQYSKWEYNDKCWQFLSTYTEITPALIQTLENAKNYVQRLIKVHPRLKNIYVYKNREVEHTPKLGDNWIAPPDFEFQVENIDLYIAVVYRPFRSQNYPATLAYITSIDIPAVGGTLRPLTGMIVASMDKHKYPCDSSGNVTAEDENTPNAFFFWNCVKNIIQILGFQKSQYGNYHPQDSNTQFQESTKVIQANGKTYKFLITPYAHKFAKRHFGVENFNIGGTVFQSGIELQDSVFSEYSNLEGRTLFGDIMADCYPGYLYPRITDATAAVLLDTGNYEINWSMVQPHEWGHKDSIDGNYIEDFATGNPQNVYPRYYQMDSSSESAAAAKVTGFNFKFVGHLGDYTPVSQYSSTQDDQKTFKNNMRFFNPNNWIYASKFSIADYAVIKPVKQYCPPYTAILPSEGGPTDFNNPNSKAYKVYPCGEYDCQTYDEFKYRLYNNSQRTQYVDIICNKDNANVKFSHTVDDSKYTMWCPEPDRFCRAMNLNHAYFTSNPFDDENFGKEDILPLPTTIPPTIAPSPEQTLAPTLEPTPSAWPTERPPELWTDQPEEMFVPKKTRTPVPLETPVPTAAPEQTDYPKQVMTPDQSTFILPTINIPDIAGLIGSSFNQDKKTVIYDGSTHIIVIGIIAIIVIIDIAVILNIYFIYKKGKQTGDETEGLSAAEFNV